MGTLKVADTAVPVTTLLSPLVLVGVLVAPLVGFVETTVVPCASVGSANPTKRATSGNAASENVASRDCGFKVFPKIFIFVSSIERRQQVPVT
jgi:hypothetical protein